MGGVHDDNNACPAVAMDKEDDWGMAFLALEVTFVKSVSEARVPAPQPQALQARFIKPRRRSGMYEPTSSSSTPTIPPLDPVPIFTFLVAAISLT